MQLLWKFVSDLLFLASELMLTTGEANVTFFLFASAVVAEDAGMFAAAFDELLRMLEGNVLSLR